MAHGERFMMALMGVRINPAICVRDGSAVLARVKSFSRSCRCVARARQTAQLCFGFPAWGRTRCADGADNKWLDFKPRAKHGC